MEACCAVGSETCHFASQLPRGVSGSHPTRLNGLRDCGPPSAGFRHRVGTRSQQGRDFLAALPGKEVCAGSHPPAGPAQEMRRESQEPGLPGPAAPPRRPSSPVLDCRKRAGGNALPGGWVGEAASAPAPPASQARGGAALSLRQTRRPPPAARRRSRCSLPIGIARRCCSPTLGGRSREAGSDRRRRPPARSPRRWGWAGEGDLPNPLFWEVRCWT